jgi:hypothetical protein
MWVVKFLQDNTNPVLQATIQAATNCYANFKGTSVHSQDIEAAGFGLLAMLQRSWATVARQEPDLSLGDWVAYRDCSTYKQLRKDMTYAGQAKILDVGAAAKDSAIAEWYKIDPAIGSMVHKPLDNREVWHLDKKACYALTQGDNLNSPNVINPLPICDVYLVIRIDEDGYKVKTTLEQIFINDEDMRPTEQYGPAFIKRNENSRLYQAQMFRTCINSIKVNVWVRDYSVDLEQVRKLHLNTFAHSKVKGFIWLWCIHVLPAGTRLRGKDASSACLHCGKTEDIRHMTYDCIVAAYIREIVFTEWWACTTDSKWVMQPSFENGFFNENNSTMAVAARTLNDIATYHIWKNRCNVLYGGDVMPSVVIANNIWV